MTSSFLKGEQSGIGTRIRKYVGSGPDQQYQEYPHQGLVRGEAVLMRPHDGVASETEWAMPANGASGVCGACAVPWPWADISRDDDGHEPDRALV